MFFLLPPATKLGKGYIFTDVCDPVHGRGEVLVDTPRDDYCCGRYASYWNTFLLENILLVIRVVYTKCH